MSKYPTISLYLDLEQYQCYSCAVTTKIHRLFINHSHYSHSIKCMKCLGKISSNGCSLQRPGGNKNKNDQKNLGMSDSVVCLLTTIKLLLQINLELWIPDRSLCLAIRIILLLQDNMINKKYSILGEMMIELTPP